MDPAVQLGRYQLVRRLAVGGMAEVFLARAEGAAGFHKDVVIKRILPELAADASFVQMFLNEARIAASLSHPNVVSIFDVGQAEGAYFLAMEFIDGPSLRELSERTHAQGEVWPQDLVARIIATACEGLAFAHEARDAEGRALQLVHRDVAPDNILISRQGVVKVVDFGIAKAEHQPHLTRPGLLKGKISYMAPEHLRGEKLDARADIFALGVVLYELLAARRPFEAPDKISVARAVMLEPAPPLAELRPDIDPRYAAVVERALRKDRERRYPSCRAMQEELVRALLERGAAVENVALAEFVASRLGPAARRTPSPDSEATTVPGVGLTEQTGATARLVEPPGDPSAPEPTALDAPKPEGTAVVERTLRDSPSPLELRAARHRRVWAGSAAAAVVIASVAAALHLHFAAVANFPPVANAVEDAPVEPPPSVAPAAPAPVAVSETTPAPLPAPAEPSVARPPRSTRSESRGEGTLVFQVVPWAQVVLDGKPLGMTPLSPVQVASGIHHVSLRNQRIPATRKLVVTVARGKTTVVRANLAPGR